MKDERPIQCRPARVWGVRYQRLLEYREILIHWRALERINRGISVSEAAGLWRRSRGESFAKLLQTDWVPNLVTGFLDRLPLSRLDLRLAALRHDIAYCKGGGREEKLLADRRLVIDIREAYPRSRYARWIVAGLVWLAVRSPLSRRHFCWGTRAKGLSYYERLMEGDWNGDAELGRESADLGRGRRGDHVAVTGGDAGRPGSGDGAGRATRNEHGRAGGTGSGDGAGRAHGDADVKGDSGIA